MGSVFARCQHHAETLAQMQVIIDKFFETVVYLTRKLYGRSCEKLSFVGRIDIWGKTYVIDTQVKVSAPSLEETFVHDPHRNPSVRNGQNGMVFLPESKRNGFSVPDGERTCEICGCEMKLHLPPLFAYAVANKGTVEQDKNPVPGLRTEGKMTSIVVRGTPWV